MLDLKVGEIVEVWEGDKLVDGGAKVTIMDGSSVPYEISYHDGDSVDTYWFNEKGKFSGGGRDHYLKKKEAKPYAPEFKVGDKVYCLMYGEGEVQDCSYIPDFPTNVLLASGITRSYNTESCWSSECKSTLFHLDAITFDALGRPEAIDWNYKPTREEKKAVTKLPHEFKKGEDVLYVANNKGVWARAKFKKLRGFAQYGIRESSACPTHGVSLNLLPYKGNEHLEGTKFTDDKLGAFPEGYVIPDAQKAKEIKSKKPKLKLGKACLCRDSVEGSWVLKTFVAKTLEEGVELPYTTTASVYRYCIPYKGNEYLEGTSESPNEEGDKTK